MKRSTTKERRKFAWAAAFFVVFVGIIEIYFGWASLLTPWKNLGIGTVATIVLLLAVTYLARALRLYRAYQSRLPFLDSLKLLLHHNFWNVLLPARSGEIAFPVLMHRYFDISPKESIPLLLWFRFLDLHSLILVVGTAWLWFDAPEYAPLFTVTWIAVLVAVFFSRTTVLNVLERLPGKAFRSLYEIVEDSPKSPIKLVESWFWTIVCWATKLLLLAWVVQVFTSIPFLPALLGAVGGEASSVLPLHSIGGFGTYHTGVALALLPFDVTFENAIRGGVNLHLVMLSGALFGGLVALAVPRERRIRRTAPMPIISYKGGSA